MKKKDKKKNAQQLKAEQAQFMNQFYDKLRTVMDSLGSSSAFNLLSPADLLSIYTCRVRPVKIVRSADKNEEIYGKDLKLLNEQITALLKTEQILIPATQKSVSLYDFLTHVDTIHLFYRNDYADLPNKEKFRALLPGFDDNYPKLRESAWEKLNLLLKLFTYIFSDHLESLLWFEEEVPQENNKVFDNKAFHNNYILHMIKPEKMLFDIDGKKRQIYRVGFTISDKPIWFTLTADKLGIKGTWENLPLKVYIQEHVIERIHERLGKYYSAFKFMDVMTSLISKDIIPTEDENGYLFPYRVLDKKVGYLKATRFGDILLLRTFLFITNNGTPEGKMLEKMIGVTIEDKKYLAIDKLDTLTSSDIKKNENLMSIFIQAGCGELFDLPPMITLVENREFQCADLISHYLCMDKNINSELLEAIPA